MFSDLDSIDKEAGIFVYDPLNEFSSSMHLQLVAALRRLAFRCLIQKNNSDQLKSANRALNSIEIQAFSESLKLAQYFICCPAGKLAASNSSLNPQEKKAFKDSLKEIVQAQPQNRILLVLPESTPQKEIQELHQVVEKNGVTLLSPKLYGFLDNFLMDFYYQSHKIPLGLQKTRFLNFKDFSSRCLSLFTGERLEKLQGKILQLDSEELPENLELKKIHPSSPLRKLTGLFRKDLQQGPPSIPSLQEYEKLSQIVPDMKTKPLHFFKESLSFYKNNEEVPLYFHLKKTSL